ncbi:MAG: right-handed parallel beta-helix repeat-containing protein [Planctomycetota bacterium]
MSTILGAAEIHVAPNGNDAADGSSPEQALGSIATALTLANAGDTILLGPGIHTIDAMVDLPTSVSLVGSGNHRVFGSVIRPSWTASGEFRIDGHAVRCRYAGDNRIADLVIDGNGDAIPCGIFTDNSDRITISNVTVVDTNNCGIWIHKGDDWLIEDCTVIDCGGEYDGYSSGNISFGNTRGGRISGCQISTRQSPSGRGIKTLGWNDPSYDQLAANVVIEGCTIDVKPFAAWDNYRAPDMTIEISGYNLEIRDCVLNNNVSFFPEDGPEGQLQHTNRFHHNRLVTEGAYPIEVAEGGLVIDHNYVRGPEHGIYAMRNWGHTDLPYMTIVRNVFENLRGSVVGLRSRTPHLLLAYNTMQTVPNGGMGAYGIAQLDGAESGGDSWQLIGNVLLADPERPYGLAIGAYGASQPTFTASHNLIQNISPFTGSQTLEVDPQLRREAGDQRPAPFWSPRAGSPVIDSGVALSAITDAVGVPDRGAIEHGGSEVIGPRDWQPQPLPARPAATIAGLDWRAYDVAQVPSDRQSDMRKILFLYPSDPIATGTTDDLDPRDIVSGLADDIHALLAFSGFIQVASDGRYLLRARGNDRLRVAIDEQALISSDLTHQNSRGYWVSEEVHLEAGQHQLDILWMGPRSDGAIDLILVDPQGQEQVLGAGSFSRRNPDIVLRQIGIRVTRKDAPIEHAVRVIEGIPVTPEADWGTWLLPGLIASDDARVSLTGEVLSGEG